MVTATTGLPIFAISVGLNTCDKASVQYYVQSHIQINECHDRVILVREPLKSLFNCLCPVCGKDQESTEHTCVTCAFAQTLESHGTMSGRGGGRSGGRGHIAMTQAELTNLINTRVAEALAAYQAGQPANQNHPPAPPVCTFKMFMDCKPQTFSGTEGAVGLLRWFENAEEVFAMCNCPAGDRVKYATGTLEDGALTWWNAQVQMLGIEMANATTWDDFKELMREEYCPRDEIQKLENEYYNLKMEGSEIVAYTRRSNDLATLCPNLSRPPPRRIELYLKGLAPAVKGYVTAANLDNLPRVVRLAHKITDQEVERNNLPPRVSATTSTATATTPASDNKRKWNDTDKATSAGKSQKRSDNNHNRSFSQSSSVNQGQGSTQNQGSYVGKKPQCNKCGYHHYGQCLRTCRRCEKVGHEAKDCRAPQPKQQQQQNQQHQRQQRQQPQQNQGVKKVCFQCGDEGHFKRDCPQLNQNANSNNNAGNNNNRNNNNGGNGGNGAHGRVFTIGAGEARNDGNVVTGLD
ncbi:putative transcription factor interactor and regulator CCHC(Zn) family [Helianthus annuus]|nr:putative transcription factor interactor and regulator CCHC(Zn) family [Helianthus annuus]KAJ0506166.1 putative transcription factor interactor and regulator CCHC(Zn) family [Helianthus annuus]KAJ0679091.1 putative transcription factor interactor and regulator CCHC(Zn) family [Helianthus annuus]